MSTTGATMDVDTIKKLIKDSLDTSTSRRVERVVIYLLPVLGAAALFLINSYALNLISNVKTDLTAMFVGEITSVKMDIQPIKISVDEALTKANADDVEQADLSKRLSILEETAKRAREDREKWQATVLAGMQAISATQTKQGEALSGLVATTSGIQHTLDRLEASYQPIRREGSVPN